MDIFKINGDDEWTGIVGQIGAYPNCLFEEKYMVHVLFYNIFNNLSLT